MRGRLEDIRELLDAEYSNTLMRSGGDNKFRIMDELLEGTSGDDHVIAILLDRSREDVEEHVGTQSFYSIEAQAEEKSPSRLRRYVNSPGDLTGIGVEFTEVCRDIDEKGTDGGSVKSDDVYLFFDNVSMVLNWDYGVDEKVRYRFLHTLTGQLKTRGDRGYFNCLTDVESEKNVNTLSQLFDAVVTYSEEDGYILKSGR